MTCSANGTAQLAKDVKYSLGSPWYEVPTVASTFSVKDDLTGATVTTRVETSPAAPLGAFVAYCLSRFLALKLPSAREM